MKSIQIEKNGRLGGDEAEPDDENHFDLQKVLDAIPFEVMLVDASHRILAANKFVLKSRGLPKELVVGKSCFEVVHGAKEPPLECHLNQTNSSGVSTEIEVFHKGSNRWVSLGIYATGLSSADGEPVYLHCVRDVTAFHRTTTELSQSLEHHKAIGDLLQSLQRCQSANQIMDALLDSVLSLSWLGVSTTAAAFLVKESQLEMAAHRNLNEANLRRCRILQMGECLCGWVAQTREKVICSSESSRHHIVFDDTKYHEHAILPLNHEDRVLGVLNLYLTEGNSLDKFRMDFLEAATTAAAVALAKQLAQEETQGIRENLIASQQQLLENVISSQENERKRVSRELHDQLGQSLLALMIEIQASWEKGAISTALKDKFEKQIQDTVDQVRSLAWELRPSVLDDYGLDFALASLTEKLSKQTKICIDYKYLGAGEAERILPDRIKIVLFRVAQEALNNIVRHSKAANASVILEQQHDSITLLVEDDGVGFEPVSVLSNSENSLGLLGMEERVKSQDGKIIIESSANGGTTLRAQIPVTGDSRPPEPYSKLEDQ